jgi:hypothetical protein
MCKCVLPPGVNPIAVDKYINNIQNVHQFAGKQQKAGRPIPHSRTVGFQYVINSCHHSDAWNLEVVPKFLGNL